jgi:hypothetical protein
VVSVLAAVIEALREFLLPVRAALAVGVGEGFGLRWRARGMGYSLMSSRRASSILRLRIEPQTVFCLRQ